MPRQLEQTPRCCCNKAFGGFLGLLLPEEAHSTGLPTSPRERCCTAASKVFLRAKKLWVNPPKAERAKPSLSSDYNLLFKNKIGESSLDIHRTLYLQCLNSALRRFRLLRPRLTSQPASLRLATSVAIGTGRDLPGYHTCASSPIRRIYASTVSVEVSG